MYEIFISFPLIYCISRLVTTIYNNNYNKKYEPYNNTQLIHQYDTHEIPCIIVRLFQGISTIYMTGKILYNSYNTYDTIFFTHHPLTPDIEYCFNFITAYFWFDTIVSYIGQDPQKYLFILHHLASIFIITFSKLTHYEPMDIIIAMYLLEITNPIYQLADLQLFLYPKRQTIHIIEYVNFFGLFIVRGIINPHLIISWLHTHSIIYDTYIYEQPITYKIYIYSLLSVVIGFCIGSYIWLYHKYHWFNNFYR